MVNDIKYYDYADEIISVSEINAEHIFTIYESISLQMTAYASARKDANNGINANITTSITTNDDDANYSDFPFVLFSEFAALSYQAIENTGANYIGYTPLVNHSQREAYEQFMLQNQPTWLRKSVDNSKWTDDDSKNVSGLVQPYIVQRNVDTDIISPYPIRDEYAPIAQIEPLAEQFDLLNYNAFDFSYFKRVWDDMIEYDRAVLSEVGNLELLSEKDEESNDEDEEDSSDLDDERNWPASFMAVPIYDRLDGDDDRRIVGAITAEMPWHSYFQNLIPEGIDGIMGKFSLQKHALPVVPSSSLLVVREAALALNRAREAISSG